MRNTDTHRGLDHHGTLVSHGSYDVQGIHGLTALYQTHRCLHGDEDAGASNPGAALKRGGVKCFLNTVMFLVYEMFMKHFGIVETFFRADLQ